MKISTSVISVALRLVLPMFALLLCATGCYEQNTRVVVFPDGSGRIVVTRQFTPAAARLISAQASMGGGLAAGVRTDEMFFSEKKLKVDATRLFGKGVRFVSAQRVDHNGGRGSVALYAFDKIDGVVLHPSRLLQSAMRGMDGDDPFDADTEAEADEAEATDVAGEEAFMAEDDGGGDDFDASGYSRHMQSAENAAYRFKFQSGAQPKLTVRVPAALRPQTKGSGVVQEDGEADDWPMPDMEEEFPDEARQQMMANGNPLQLTGNETSQEVMLKVYQGMRLSMDVEVRGAATAMTATYPDARQAGRCTLLRVDAGEILKSSGTKGLQMVQQMMYGQFDRMLGKPGVTTENRPEVTFTIQPAPSSDRGGK